MSRSPERPSETAGRHEASPSAVPVLALAAVALLAPRPTAGYSDGPPPGHTGGFGEPTCAACHYESGEPAEGSLRLEGVPERYRPGERYHLTVGLEDPRLERAGFELAARTAEGAQAGTLEASGERTEVVTGPEGSDGAIEYARQTARGVEPVAAHRATWSVVWTAPDVPSAEVRFHAAANAANYDASEFGDTLYTVSATISSDAPSPDADP